MAKKPTITTVASGFQATTTINNNFQNLRDAFDNTLSLDGSTPNAMNADLDMNGNDIINVGSANGNAILTVNNGDARYVNTSGDTMTGSLNTPALYTNGLYINGNPVLPSTLTYNGIVKESKVSTSGQTVFTLSGISYTPGINNLSVYVDGVYQKPSNYTETSATVVTFSVGLHVGAIVDFVVLGINTLSGTADAVNLTYTAPGTGANSRTVYSKLTETISVKDFGAVGNGVTDDTAAIQEAINYAASLVNTTYYNGETIALNGATVYFPPGMYIITSTINFKNGITLKGAGKGSTVLKSSYDGYIIRNEIYASSYNFYYGSILDLTIMGDRTKTNQIGIALLRDISGSYKNISIVDVGSHAFQLLQCIATYITDIEAVRCGGVGLYVTSGRVSWADPTSNGYPTNTITCINSYFRTNDAEGILLTGACNGNIFIGCVSEYSYASSQGSGNTGYQIRLVNTNNNMPNEFINCWVEGPCQSHVYIDTPGALDNRFTNLKHFANGPTGNVDRAIIINAGSAQVIGAFSVSAAYKLINGSTAPFRVNKPNASIKVVDCVGNLITNNNFVEDSSGNTTNLLNYATINTFGATYGIGYNKGPANTPINYWQLETQAQPFLGVQTNFGLAFGDGTNAMDAFLQHGGAGVVAVRNGTSFNTGSTWNGSHLIMGGYHLWVDGSAKLRISFGAPASDTAGTIVGTQTI